MESESLAWRSGIVKSLVGLVTAWFMLVGAATAASANANAAYSSGYAAGSATAGAAPVAGTTTTTTVTTSTGVYGMGMNYAALPAGSMAINKNGTNYYLSGNTWFQPAYGANGVYYKVVPAP